MGKWGILTQESSVCQARHCRFSREGKRSNSQRKAKGVGTPDTFGLPTPFSFRAVRGDFAPLTCVIARACGDDAARGALEGAGGRSLPGRGLGAPLPTGRAAQ